MKRGRFLTKLIARDIREGEAEALSHVLDAIRKSARTLEQLTILFDPYVAEEGGAVFVAYSPEGYQVEVRGPIRGQVIRKPKRRRAG